MELEKIEVNEQTIDLNLTKILNNEDKLKLQSHSNSINVWMPDNYNNLISEVLW